ncbi:MAG TPA: hypothetical protein VLD17_07465 [Gemmatimonadaceae bacterium]|nr:hypothetical protein [Gemmatimonadaceae bacterium]
MKHRWAALLTVLALGTLVPTSAAAQGTTISPPTAGERNLGVQLGQNFPNPFNPATVIPFTIGDPPTCSKDAGRQHRVSLRIYNVLAQLVGIPVLQGTTGSSAGGGSTSNTDSGRPVVNVTLTCGSYTAFWNGNYMNTARQVPSGVYIYVIEFDGHTLGRKMIVLR